MIRETRRTRRGETRRTRRGETRRTRRGETRRTRRGETRRTRRVEPKRTRGRTRKTWPKFDGIYNISTFFFHFWSQIPQNVKNRYFREYSRRIKKLTCCF